MIDTGEWQGRKWNRQEVGGVGLGFYPHILRQKGACDLNEGEGEDDEEDELRALKMSIGVKRGGL